MKTKEIIRHIESMAKGFLDDCDFAISLWTRNDVKTACEINGWKSLTPEEEDVVLQITQDNFDANAGINWDAITQAIIEAGFNKPCE